MPYALSPSGPDVPGDWDLRLWPHNALPRRGFAIVIGGSAFVLALPLVAVLGHPVLWGLLPFAGLVLWGLWAAIRRNWLDRSVIEEMHLSRNGLHLRRLNPRGPVQEWRADPAWVALHLTPKGGPVEQYLTLTGGGREVELGAFLTPDERLALHRDLDRLLLRLKTFAGP
jgi:uncharacterized membrane protein